MDSHTARGFNWTLITESSEVYAFISTSRDIPATMSSSSILGQVEQYMDEDHWYWPLSLNLSLFPGLTNFHYITTSYFHCIT